MTGGAHEHIIDSEAEQAPTGTIMPSSGTLPEALMTRNLPLPHLGLVLAMCLGMAAGCGSGTESGGGNISEIADAPKAEAAAATSGEGACALLTMAEAKAAFPDVTSATQEESLVKQGIRACDWGDGPGGRTFQVRISASTVEDELGTFESGVVDPFKQTKLTREPFAGGGQVIIASRAETPNVVQEVAVAAVQKGANTIVVVTSRVDGDRNGLKERLGTLAATAASRAS